jgi:hypothetical protein
MASPIMESSSASSSTSFPGPSLSPGGGQRSEELHRIASQLQAEIDALREFSELERAFLESQVAEGEERAAQLQNCLTAASDAQERAASKTQLVQDENANLYNEVRHLKVDLWKAKLAAKQNAGGLAWYRDGLMAASVGGSDSAHGSSSSSCVGGGGIGVVKGAGVSREALQAATRKILIVQ